MVNFVSAVAGVVAAFFSVMVYILMTRKTTVVLTFNNNKDTIEYKAGVNYAMHFSLTNIGRVNAHSVEGVVYFPNDFEPELRDNAHPEKVEYFMDPERVVLRVENLPPKSNLIERHLSIVKFPIEPQKYEFNYETTGERVKRTKGKLTIQTK